MAPGVTTNPHNAAHTPGGSSSGSAAAVADHMVPAALGTQTGGSVLRPVSFCGIFGFKPTYNTFNKMGVWPAADSIDTVGLHARSIDDIELLTAVLRMQAPQPPRQAQRRSADRIVPDGDLGHGAAGDKGGGRGRCRRARQGRRHCERDHVACGVQGHAWRGAQHDQFRTSAPPAWRSLWDNHREALSPQMRRYVEGGQKTTREEYVAAFAAARRVPRVVVVDLRPSRRAAGAVRARRGAQGSGIHRRCQHAGDLDGTAHAVHDTADPSRPERSAGRHSDCRATLRGRSFVGLCALDLGKNRRAGDGRMSSVILRCERSEPAKDDRPRRLGCRPSRAASRPPQGDGS